MNIQETDFAALFIQVIHRLFNRLSHRTHGNNDLFSIFNTIICN